MSRLTSSASRDEGALSPKVIAGLVVGVLIAVGVGLSVYAFIYVWYRTTGFKEQNHPAFKPQENQYPAAVAGAIPISGVEPPSSTRAQARQLTNPVRATAASLAEGKDLYFNYCSPCHGEAGDGRGLMGSVPALAPVRQSEIDSLTLYLQGFLTSPDIELEYLLQAPPGDLYYSITNGGEAIMPSFKDALSPEQRWAIINYIRIVLGENSAR